MTVEDEKDIKSSNKCWVCSKLFVEGDIKVRDHDHMAAKYRGSAHWDCDINLKLNKEISVIFHNLRGYDSHFIMQEINMFDVKISALPNGSEKHMDFTINKNLGFIVSMRFTNATLDALVKNCLKWILSIYHKNLVISC